MSYLIRVHLPDRPGSLGALAVALGRVGADILSFDVVDRENGTVVDDLVVDVPSGTLPDTLITAAEALKDVQVDSILPYSGMLDHHRELELIAAIGASPTGLQMLADQAPSVLRCSWAVVLGGTPRGRLAASGSAPETLSPDIDWIPLRRPRVFDADESWVPPVCRDLEMSLAAAPLDPGRALLVGRQNGVEFLPTEVARLGFFAEIVGRVLR